MSSRAASRLLPSSTATEVPPAVDAGPDDGVEPIRPSATRDRIVNTALQLYSARGTAAVAMRELAEAAGVTVPGLYYHFASKAELIRAVYQARGQAVKHALGDAPLRAQTVERRIIEQAGREYQRTAADADFLRLMHGEAIVGDADALEAGSVLGEEWRSRWRDVLAGARDIDPACDLDDAADVIATYLWGLFAEQLMTRGPEPVARVVSFAHLLAPSLTRRRRATGR